MTADADTPDDMGPGAKPHEVFSVYSSVSGRIDTFEDPRAAGRAFFQSDPAERPSVTHLVGNSARTMARTEINGVHPGGEPRYFKSLPSSHAPDAAFREGFLEAMENSIAERLRWVDWSGKNSPLAKQLESRLEDDLEAFAYREPGKAATLWAAHLSERRPGPVLRTSLLAHETEAKRERGTSTAPRDALEMPERSGHALAVELRTPPVRPRRETAIYAGNDPQLIVSFGRDDEDTRALAERLVANPAFCNAVAKHISDARETVGRGTFVDGEGSRGFLPDEVLAVTAVGTDGATRTIAQLPDRSAMSAAIAAHIRDSPVLERFAQHQLDREAISARALENGQQVTKAVRDRTIERKSPQRGVSDSEL